MKKRIFFHRVAKFKFNDKIYQVFRSNNGKVAFLEYKENKYYYPTYRDFMVLVSFFTNYDINLSLFQNKNHKLVNFKPKLVTKSGLVMITSALLLQSLTGCSKNEIVEYDAYIPNYSSTNFESNYGELPNYSDNVELVENADCYETQDFDIMKSSRYIQLYNNKYFTELFGKDSYTKEELHNVVQGNKKIPAELQYYFIDFIDNMYDYYPNLDFRVFCENMRNLRIEYRDQETIELTTNSVAYYHNDDNYIVISKNIDFENNIKDLLVLRHEIGHMFNTLKVQKDGWDIKYNFNDVRYGKFTKEGMDVLFTTLPFLDEYQELDNFGYPITTNTLQAIIESLPTYNIEDSISNNVYYLEKMLNEYMKDDIAADVIIELIELQWYEYSSDMIEVDEQDYIDLYSYIARLYIKTNVSENMTFNEIMQKEKKLEELLVRGVKDETMVYTNTIEEEFIKYLELHNIKRAAMEK